jgi:hypothetical protein
MRTALRVLLLWLVLLAGLCGCTESFVLNAFVDPPTGHVPYAARIVCTSLPGTYTYELPDGTSVTTRESHIDVVVDRLAWSARVTWTDGEQVRVVDATAQGTNEVPLILAPRLNGDPYQGVMRPREATLIDFTHYPAGLSGPESGVLYDGTWRIVSVRVEADGKAVCGAAMGDSVYTPPWADGVFHAFYRGHVWDNACLVYPLYTAELAANGLPYAPEALTGYIHDGARNRNVLLDVEFPEQTAVVTVVVEDDWGRRTSASFPFPVAATTFSNVDDPHHDRPTLFKNAVFFVSSRTGPYFYHRDCPEVCSIPGPDRLYFSSEANAEAAGKRRSPDCPSY